MNSIKDVLIVGAGWTGRQIAAQCAAHGVRAILLDQSISVSRDALEWAKQHLQARKEEGTWPQIDVASCEGHLVAVESLSEVDHCDLVLETVVEQPSIKRRVLKEVSQKFPSPTIIVSNSSYFVPSMLVKFVEGPERFAHLHFHVPIWLSTVVDIVPGPTTEPNILDRLADFARTIGQTPILEMQENPGYIFNWLLQAWLKAALELVDRGVATPEQIDEVWTKVSGMKAGPFMTMDHIGLDVIHQVLCNARWSQDGSKLDPIIDILSPKVDAGEVGTKSGKGFYDHRSER